MYTINENWLISLSAMMKHLSSMNLNSIEVFLYTRRGYIGNQLDFFPMAKLINLELILVAIEKIPPHTFSFHSPLDNRINNEHNWIELLNKLLRLDKRFIQLFFTYMLAIWKKNFREKKLKSFVFFLLELATKKNRRCSSLSIPCIFASACSIVNPMSLSDCK